MSQIIRTKDWKSILRFYQEFDEKQQLSTMVALVESIENSEYSSSLYAYTSVITLCIGQHPELSPNNALLNIEPIASKGLVNFKYKGDNTLEYSWCKEVSAQNAYLEFVRFIKALKWVVYPSKPTM